MNKLFWVILILFTVGCKESELCHANGIRRIGELMILPNLPENTISEKRSTVLSAFDIAIVVQKFDHKITCEELNILNDGVNIMKYGTSHPSDNMIIDRIKRNEF